MKSEKQIVADIIAKAEQKGSGIYYGKRFAVPTGRERMTGEGCHECEMAYITKGGGWKTFWKGLKKTSKKAWKAAKPIVKKGHRWMKKNKVLSKALKEIAPLAGPAAPKVALAAKASKALGYGLKPTGTGIRPAGMGIKVAGTGNPWVNHCRRYAAKHGCTYAEALKRAGKTYKKKK